MAVISTQRRALLAKFSAARHDAMNKLDQRYGYVALFSAVPCATNPMGQPRELAFPGYARQRVPVFNVPGTDLWLHRDWTSFGCEWPKHGASVTHMALFEAPENGGRLLPLDIELNRTFVVMPGESLNVPGMTISNH